MQFAFSTVLGGMPVYATDCTYDDTIELLTTCPICSSAVHLRSAGERTDRKTGKTIIVNPCFAHYKAGNANDYECSARCKSTEGQQILQRQESIFRGQRLEWYNDRLWSVVAEHENITPQLITILIRRLGIGAIRQAARNWRKNYKYDRPMIMEAIQTYKDSSLQEFEMSRYVPDDPRYQSIKSYFYSVDKKLHADICLEIMDFMATSSGGYALEKFIPTSIRQMDKKNPELGEELIWRSFEASTQTMGIMLSRLVFLTHWANWFYPMQNDETPLGRKSLAT
jgi:hypothetical protein